MPFLSLLLGFVALSGVATGGEESTLSVPGHFSNLDINQYTIRYVNLNGADTEECLLSQPLYQTRGGCNATSEGSPISYCKSVGYSILGNCSGHDYKTCTANVTSNLIIMLSEGENYYDDNENVTVEVKNFENFMIRRIPECTSESIIFCRSYTEEVFNNLFINSSRNIAIDGVTFANCGPKSGGIFIEDSYNAAITNSVFRYLYIILWTLKNNAIAIVLQPIQI